MLAAASSRAIRYCDMVLTRDAARTTNTTRSAKRDRFSAAWPAELAAPTMYTSSPGHWLASLAVDAVVDAAPGELRQAGGGQPSVGNAGRHDERPGLDLPGAVRAAPRGPGRGPRSRRRRGPAPARPRSGTPGPGPVARGRSRSAPSGIRGSSRSPHSARPGRRAPRVRRPPRSGPRTPRTPQPPGPPGHRRRCTRRRAAAARWCAGRVRPLPGRSRATAGWIRRAPAPAAGRRRSACARSRNRSASASRSMSYQ